jgi:hypothetical protein
MGDDDLAPAKVDSASRGGQALKSSIKLKLAQYLGDYTDDVLVECVFAPVTLRSGLQAGGDRA